MGARGVVVLVFFCATADSRQTDEEWLTLDALAAPQKALLLAPLGPRWSDVAWQYQRIASSAPNSRHICGGTAATGEQPLSYLPRF